MNFRRTRFEFLAPILFALRIDPPKQEREKRLLVPTKRFTYAAPIDGVSGTVEAHTRSEARAQIKQRHGLRRVPVGAVITQL